MRYPVGTIFKNNVWWEQVSPTLIRCIKADGRSGWRVGETLTVDEEDEPWMGWEIEYSKERLFTKLYLTLKSNA